MLKAIIRRVLWMLAYRQRHGALPRCGMNGCRGLATHTAWGYQGDDLRDVDVCWRHSNKPEDAKQHP